jgi:hypothetical protein
VNIEALMAENKELRFALDREIDERNKIGLMHDELCRENVKLEREIKFLSGQIEAYKYCIENIRR